MGERRKRPEAKKLEVKCSSTDCGKGLHCFMPAPQNRRPVAGGPYPPGSCHACGVSLVEWPRVHELNLLDVQYTFEALKHELIRHTLWHAELDQAAINHALRKGRIGMRAAVEERVLRYLKDGVPPDKPTFDGRRTPFEGNVIFYAQHATATCCRKCMAVWHGIPRERNLTKEELRYFVDLIALYIQERMPDLPERGQKIPAIRKAKVAR